MDVDNEDDAAKAMIKNLEAVKKLRGTSEPLDEALAAIFGEAKQAAPGQGGQQGGGEMPMKPTNQALGNIPKSEA